MKTGLTIQQMAQELLRQSKAKQDYLVNTGSLSLSVTSDAPQLRVTENGLDKIAPLDIRQTAHRQLGTYLGIPQKYYELMRTDAPELLAYNANYWFSQKNELRTLRTMDGCARAFLSNRYRRIDNLDIASVTLPVIGELPEARFVSTQITDDFMYIKVVNPRLQADVVPGDVVQAGVIISNSETGLGSVTIQPLIYRLVCSNGMVINDAKTRRNHVGRAATSEEDFSIYSSETLLADDHAFVLKIKDTVRAAISEARFAQVVSRMRESTEAMLDTKQLPAIVKLASSSFGITEDESNGVLEHLITGGDFSLYGLANAVTRFSQDVESYYDIAAIGYLHAVQRYFTEKSLHRYRFSTIAWRSMNSSLNTFRRQEQRRQSHEFSYQAAHPPPDDAFDALRARLLLHDLFLLADEEQALLIRHRLHGCSLAETARREGMSVKRVRHRLKALYRAYFAQKETKQKEL